MTVTSETSRLGGIIPPGESFQAPLPESVSSGEICQSPVVVHLAAPASTSSKKAAE